METTDALRSTTAAMLARGKGILAADEPAAVADERFAASGIVSGSDARRDYRELLFATPGLGSVISAVILVDETLRQTTAAGVSMPHLLGDAGIVPGIAVDGGTIALAGCPGEELTEGLDGLRDRLAGFRELGARFTKWRAVFAIGDGLPTDVCISTNAHALAVFAAQSHEAGLVPLVEPDLLMRGDHSLARCEEVAGAILDRVFATLTDHSVALEHVILKVGMVVPGSLFPEPVDDRAIADATLRCLRRAVPAAIPGIAFLPGGQSETTATARMNAICGAGDVPWRLTFSFSRALQAPVLAAWKGLAHNIGRAQAALYHRARCNSAATLGEYSMEMDAP
jgi:fructose-bisphosphate aldolase, class I